MKWAQALVVLAAFFQRDTRLDNLNDIDSSK